MYLPVLAHSPLHAVAISIFVWLLPANFKQHVLTNRYFCLGSLEPCIWVPKWAQTTGQYNVSFFDPFLPCTHYSRAITLDKLFTNPFPTL